ncbi:adenylate kinase 8 [Chelonus insularis]|uniref:adenylate kinase 8 n=1 Tax=Chelonus insularis TaxID=460826 RepID=UPI00158EFAA8|nr:adenylate kinase 8 [Chelonus insularis]
MDTEETIQKHARFAQFLSYLERHKIYELFFEIITLLVMEKPIDPLSYIKNSLHLAVKRRDTLRIILLSPPNFDKELLAEYLEIKLGINRVSLQNIQPLVSSLTRNFAKNVERTLEEQRFHETGWLFIDFPRSKLEARALQRIGVLPTHVIEIVWTNKSDNSSDDDNSLNSSSSTRSSQTCEQTEEECYNLNINGLREAYANKLTILEIAGRTYEELGNLIIKLTKKQRYYVPCIFRVLLIGSRGSGCRSVARYLSQRYGLVHIDFDYLLEQTRKQNFPLGKELRRIEDRWGTLPKSDIRIKVVENKLMSHECIKKGWVLTGYPLTVKDFQLLNSLTTPPNRIIFLNVDQMTCKERLLSRRFNLLTGSEHHLPSDDFHSYEGLGIRPKDIRSQVEQDLEEYQKNIGMLLEYAGESVNVIDGVAEKRVVQERVEACLARPVTCGLLNQTVKLSKNINSKEKIFHPDESLKPKISRHFYETDSEFSLI